MALSSASALAGPSGRSMAAHPVASRACPPPARAAARPSLRPLPTSHALPSPLRLRLRRGGAVACRAAERYVLEKLAAAESTYRELQLRMADPTVAANAGEFQKVAKAASDLEETVNAYRSYRETEAALQARGRAAVRAALSACTPLRPARLGGGRSAAASANHEIAVQCASVDARSTPPLCFGALGGGGRHSTNPPLPSSTQTAAPCRRRTRRSCAAARAATRTWLRWPGRRRRSSAPSWTRWRRA
jgi:hypothetical protein